MTETVEENDARWMERCLALAQQALTLSNPNPRVGCVIVTAEGVVLGEGHTQAAGSAHAEVMALRDAQAKGHSVQGATAYVSLEPCAHHGRTPPCCDALVAAGIARVVAAMPDPNPLVAGQGFARLKNAGIDVCVGVGAAAAAELNAGFLSRIVRKRPWVRVKSAASLDGVTALANGQSQWITAEPARKDGQVWRARACALLTGIGTILHDDPLLNVRDIAATRQPHLVILDSHLRTPANARLFDVPNRQVLIYTLSENAALHAALEARGAKVVICPAAAVAGGPQPQVDLAFVMRHLADWPVNELHVEAGAAVNGALLQEGLVDEWLLYLAPKMLGGGKGIAVPGQLFTTLEQAQNLAFVSTAQVGADLRILGRATAASTWLQNIAALR